MDYLVSVYTTLFGKYNTCIFVLIYNIQFLQAKNKKNITIFANDAYSSLKRHLTLTYTCYRLSFFHLF